MIIGDCQMCLTPSQTLLAPSLSAENNGISSNLQFSQHRNDFQGDIMASPSSHLLDKGTCTVPTSAATLNPSTATSEPPSYKDSLGSTTKYRDGDDDAVISQGSQQIDKLSIEASPIAKEYSYGTTLKGDVISAEKICESGSQRRDFQTSGVQNWEDCRALGPKSDENSSIHDGALGSKTLNDPESDAYGYSHVQCNPIRSQGDQYTPRYIRGVGRTKMGMCPACESNGVVKWFKMKCSAYW
ncbi:hypothetical protein H4219_000288 [Mycoemilia scoparia]|uniref:Transcription regulator Rua1 C-terminal domain-containing protein n=1 Tax=Mycoemilia scoparia TaxID=417184 RepID=A0A9W8DWT4_9FUNG|nr:hypothetical protein H4219_000288 [Mycoemilia scoparia]